MKLNPVVFSVPLYYMSASIIKFLHFWYYNCVVVYDNGVVRDSLFHHISNIWHVQQKHAEQNKVANEGNILVQVFNTRLV